MKYKIVVDKQSRVNPSAEKREYEIDIEELRVQGNVYDSLVITKDEDYVIRRLSLSEYHVLSVLEEPIREELTGLNIELFEGDNYIYLIDMTGNKFYAEYLIKNDFTDTYVTVNQMNSAVNQTAQQIELTVNQKLNSYATNEDVNNNVTELNSKITQTATQINSEVMKKVGNNEIISKINQSAEEVAIKASKINLNGAITANNNFKINKDGSMEATNGTFNGGNICLEDIGKGNPKFILKSDNYYNRLFSTGMDITLPPKNGAYEVRASLRVNKDTGNFDFDLEKGDGKGIHFTPTDVHFSGLDSFYANCPIRTANAGYAVYGKDMDHKYFQYWTGSQLQFWVDQTNVGTLSDKRLKTEIKDIDIDLINAIKEIEMKQFKIANRNGLISFGILAQDLIEIFKKYNKNPFDYEIVQETQYRIDDDTIYYTINYEQYLILKSKAQEKELEELKERIEKLEVLNNGKN